MEIRPTYEKCTISSTFIYYHLFYKWCVEQIGFNQDGFELDKDLLIKNNKLYSEHTCIFIPGTLNLLLTKRNCARGIYPIGVNIKGSRFQAYCNTNTKASNYLGLFDTPELAFQAYKTFKEAYIKEQAELYKDSIDPRAYLALLNYEVSIDD
jgi:hypothetical protein